MQGGLGRFSGGSGCYKSVKQETRKNIPNIGEKYTVFYYFIFLYSHLLQITKIVVN